MMVVWTKVVAVEGEEPSGCVDGLDGKCERKREDKDGARILEK